MQIEIDFDLFQALTTLRRSEDDSYSDVIRRLLDTERRSPSLNALAKSSPTYGDVNALMLNSLDPIPPLVRNALFPAGFISRDLFLPDGTKLRASYKGTPHYAEIIDGKWVSADGSIQSSPSSAATHITNNNVNGLRFWEAKRPTDSSWRLLAALVGQKP